MRLSFRRCELDFNQTVGIFRGDIELRCWVCGGIFDARWADLFPGYWRGLSPSLPQSAEGKIVFPRGPSRREKRTNHFGIVLSECGVRRSVEPSQLSGFFYYRQPHVLYLKIYVYTLHAHTPNMRWRTSADWWLGHLSLE